MKKIELKNVENANLYREIFPYSDVPKINFNMNEIKVDIPDKIWITDTTFRDGQQSMTPFTVEQIVKLFDYLNKLDNNTGVIRQTEFFLYTNRDKEALIECMQKGYKFPEITTWIRANKNDFSLVKDIGIKETGILMSCSDYHIFKKLNMNREQTYNKYIEIVEEALSNGIVPRCHLEDITRADFFGFVVPLVNKLMELSDKYGIQVKIRACDTLGLGVSFPGVELPRSVPAIISGLRKYCNVPASALEWHGHNDFYCVVPNATAAWMYGCSSVNTTLLGIGERTGNCPLEAMVFQYCQLKGNPGMNIHAITEIAKYFENEMKYEIPPRTPFVGTDFNVTRAGIHADGILKDQEIYNIFDTEKILDRPVLVAINEYSGSAGIAAWINIYFKLNKENEVHKKDDRVAEIKKWVDNQYEGGRTTSITNKELEIEVKRYFKELIDVENTRAS
ncbi:beta/alpha barrel domain-containing protein [Clostridium felsineum]|uniref:Citrate (Re)-synthase n=1 Tax=Clostridium felsineum TaxID=36839 RepID=A0A1S8LJF2_9CLOT|nr:2-isopropylmalate synthase [Clostridium felsineum]MCR3760064.1 2-isopropylmalate synthase [Clostridium felsineum]URZ01396.1 Citrate (Re)-synthase [Clostridium felsineum]URZ05760.1 Citrate (Re)-synthase [Clostridium felsineum]URZ10799.1 Citrate (Re)-synthase [Clostridium felsineum]